MEHLVGIMRGENESYSFWVELYMKSIDNLTLYLNRIDYSVLKTEDLKKTLEELLNERALSLGITQETTEGVKATESEFPKPIVEFLIFYKLLTVILKLAIAKKDEQKITEKRDEYQKQLDVITMRKERLELRINMMKNIDNGESKFDYLD